jgi:uncharacterized peroxidase-related enzyme
MMAVNYRVARRECAMLGFAVKLATKSWTIEEADRAHLRAAGFFDRGIRDISAAAAFYQVANRLASARAMRPNREYHRLAR